MADDLKILITGTLNTGKSITEINRAIKGIEKKIANIKVNLDVDQVALKGLKQLGSTGVKSLTGFETAQRNLQKGLVNLARTGKYTTDELRKIGQGISFAKNLDELEKMRVKMNTLKFGGSLQGQQDQLRDSLKKLYDQGKVTENFYRNFNKVINSTNNVKEVNKVNDALKRVQQTMSNKATQQNLLADAQKTLNSTKNTNDKQRLTTLINDLKAIKPNAQNASNALKQLQANLNGIRQSSQEASRQTNSLASQIGHAASKFGLWLGASALVFAPIRALQDMSERLIEIDTQMTGLARVMDMPDFKFTELLHEAVDASDELSSKLTDVLSIMNDFGRMGFDENQLMDITKTVQMLQNISDLDAESSVNTLTSAMLNFNIAAEDSVQIANKLNEVDNNFAISTKDLSDGIRKAASTAKTFGVDIDELNGYIAAIGNGIAA